MRDKKKQNSVLRSGVQDKIPVCKDFDYDFSFLHFLLLSPDKRSKTGSFLKQSKDFTTLWSRSFLFGIWKICHVWFYFILKEEVFMLISILVFAFSIIHRLEM